METISTTVYKRVQITGKSSNFPVTINYEFIENQLPGVINAFVQFEHGNASIVLSSTLVLSTNVSGVSVSECLGVLTDVEDALRNIYSQIGVPTEVV